MPGSVACPSCHRPAQVVEVVQCPFGGYGIRCLNPACGQCELTVVWHGEATR